MTKEKKLKGLTAAQVAERISQGKTNAVSNLKTKSVGRIFYDNICTLFNLINVILFLSLIFVGSYKNTFFIGVIFFNTIIGIVQELRSKKSVDKLTILSESKQKVLRDGKLVRLGKDEIVLDDIILLSRGDQIPADCVVVSGECKVNESLLTGESNLIVKRENDKMLSGSFIAAGKCYARIECVGENCYASKINNEAKYIKKNNSQILHSFKFIIKICSIIIFPLAALLCATRLLVYGKDLAEAVVSTVGALVGMIPGGMILLTSTVLAVSIVRLSKRKVLVNEMYCIESLARVDVLCLDKTGTLTADEMNVSDMLPFGAEEDEIKTALASIVAASEDVNATAQAVADYTQEIIALGCESFVPFSSETKWSGGTFSNGKTYVMGAAEFVFPDKEKYSELYEAINSVSETVRILALGKSEREVIGGNVPSDLKPIALVLIKDTLRPNVNETINYFKEQGVAIKVISGDSVKTVKNIALDTGIEGAENAVDMSQITTEEELYEAAENCSVFGRVTPAQKKKLVLALKKHGHNVAMTGDGVNDVLALKEADCSVALASGSEAARNVSQLVLVNNDFSSMPAVVAEGRRTINNIERSSSLYLVKTIYSIILSIFFIFSSVKYPFEPIQLTLIGALTTGFPSFVLALQPNKNRVTGSFTKNIISRALPAAICVVLDIILLVSLKGTFGISQAEISTIACFTTALSCILLVIRLSIPFNVLRTAMLVISVSGFTLACLLFGKFFMITALSFNALLFFAALAAATAVLFNVMYNFANNFIKEK